MLPEAPIDAAIARLEQLFPGLIVAATASHAAERARRLAIGSRVGQRLTASEFPLAWIVLIPDTVIDQARACGAAIDGHPIADELIAMTPLLAELADEPLLIVTHSLTSHRARADELLAQAQSADFILEGDLICVATMSPRVLILHHSEWLFDLRAAP